MLNKCTLRRRSAKQAGTSGVTVTKSSDVYVVHVFVDHAILRYLMQFHGLRPGQDLDLSLVLTEAGKYLLSSGAVPLCLFNRMPAWALK